MSHIATVELEVKDLDCLAKAARRLGLELRLGQQTYRWFGESVGNCPLPSGFTVEELGKCQHALSIPGSEAYEIGVVQRRDGRPGFSLVWDFYEGGYGLESLVGAQCAKLKQAYAAEVSIKQARMQGFQVREELRSDGSLRLTLSK